MLMGQVPNFGGYVEGPLVCTKQAVFCAERDHLCFVDYDTLVKNPEIVMRKIYDFLGEPWYEHDFDNVESSYDEFDEDVQLPGLHTTWKKVEWRPRETILPPDIWNKVQGMEVWR